MSILDGFKNLVRPYDEDDMYDDEFAEHEAFSAEDDIPVATHSEPQAATTTTTTYAPPVSTPSFTSTVDSRTDRGFSTTAPNVVLQPKSYADRIEIADHVLQKRTVAVNTELLHEDVTVRIMDFLSGIVYANRGDMKKVAANAFIIASGRVDVASEVEEKIKNNEFHI